MVYKGNHPLLWPQDSGWWNIIIYPEWMGDEWISEDYNHLMWYLMIYLMIDDINGSSMGDEMEDYRKHFIGIFDIWISVLWEAPIVWWVPVNHPVENGIFHYKLSSYWGSHFGKSPYQLRDSPASLGRKPPSMWNSRTSWARTRRGCNVGLDQR